MRQPVRARLALILAAGVFAGTAIAAGPRHQPRYLDHPIDVIDIHMHPGTYENLGPVGRDYLRATLPNFLPDFLKDLSLSMASRFLLNPYGPWIGIKHECEQAGVRLCGLFSVYAPLTWGVAANEDTTRYLDDRRNQGADGKPVFFGLASVRMQNWELNETQELAQLRQSLKHPLMKGIKLAFIHNAIPLDDAQYDSIYQVAAALNVPVYHHVGSSPLQKLTDFPTAAARADYLRSYDPAGLERAIRKFPTVKFILGHMGFDFNNEGVDATDQVLALAERYANVFLEISAFGDPMHDPQGSAMLAILASIKDRGLIDRTIYGSDGPTIPGGTKTYLVATLSAMEKLGFSHAEAQAVLAENSIKLFKLPRP